MNKNQLNEYLESLQKKIVVYKIMFFKNVRNNFKILLLRIGTVGALIRVACRRKLTIFEWVSRLSQNR